MSKHTLIAAVLAPYSSQMHYPAPLPASTQLLELSLIGAQNLGPVLYSDIRGLPPSYEPNEKHSTLKSQIGLWQL